jgi:hypothetical protein
LPPEFCEFGPSFDKCKPWIKENFPDLYPSEVLNPAEGSADKPKEEVKILPGGKVKKKVTT